MKIIDNGKVLNGIGMRCIQDCREGKKPNMRGLTEDEAKIAVDIYELIPQYRVAARKLASGKLYSRKSPQVGGYKNMRANEMEVYEWTNHGGLRLVCSCSVYRAERAMAAYRDYQNGKIDPAIWDNYITDGHNTKRGLYANYDSKKKDRIRQIARSHADYMGSETGNSKYDHDQRVRIRN